MRIGGGEASKAFSGTTGGHEAAAKKTVRGERRREEGRGGERMRGERRREKETGGVGRGSHGEEWPCS